MAPATDGNGSQPNSMNMPYRSTGEANREQTETVSAIPVQDCPSELWIYKTEDGDSMVGNRNGLRQRDSQGIVESSGGLKRKYL